MTRRLLPFLLLVLAAGCRREQAPATGCRTDGQCARGSRCTAGFCQADTRPTASIAPLGPVEEYALVQLDGSGSMDPDGDVSDFRWMVRSVDAPCAPPEVAGREPTAVVRFGCAGKYEVALTVGDVLGLDSDPARAEVTVRPTTAAPIVSTGPDLASDHACSGSPLVCRPTSVIQLSASFPEGATLRWSVQPPAERPLDAKRRVTFSPDAHAATPTAQIETDGTAISGDWIFRAELIDAHGVLGAAHTRVSVRNRPPVVRFAPAQPFEHAFDPAASAFTSRGDVAWSAHDPDGDPIEQITGVWRHVGDGEGSVFDGDFSGSSVSFEVVVPYAVPADGLKLRGGSALVRQIEISAVDVNRTVGSGTLPIEIGNRPPVPSGGTFDTSVGHSFDPVLKRYFARARAGTFVDPDGDPIVDSTGPGLCDTLLAQGNQVTVECSAPFEGVPAVEKLAGVRTFAVAARDPWEPATQVPVRTVEIRNAPPTVSAGTPSPASVSARMYIKLDSCQSDYVVDETQFDVSVNVSDPDGDPVLVSATTSPGGTISTGSVVTQAPLTIPLHIVQPAWMWHCARTYPTPPISTAVGSDGAASTRIGVSPTPVTVGIIW